MKSRRSSLPSGIVASLILVSVVSIACQSAGPGAAPAPAVEAKAEVTLKVGDKAPDFTLPDHNGNDTKLSDFQGKKNVVLAFYVLAFTGG